MLMTEKDSKGLVLSPLQCMPGFFCHKGQCTAFPFLVLLKHNGILSRVPTEAYVCGLVHRTAAVSMTTQLDDNVSLGSHPLRSPPSRGFGSGSPLWTLLHTTIQTT